MLSGRRIVVAGAGGIGSAVARHAAAAGARVHLVDRLEDVRELAAELGASVSVSDLTDEAEVDRAFADAADALGGLDGLVVVAGGSGRRLGDGPAHTLATDAIRSTLDLNLLPPTLALGAFLRRCHPDAPARGAVLIGSVLATRPHPLFSTHAYAMAKAAIEGLTRAAAARYAAEGVQVNAVAAGLARTPMSARAQADPETKAFALARQPLADEGFVSAGEVASACCWLLSTREVTGQVIAVDGGWSVC